MIGFIAILLTLVYILIGWFIRTLLQDDWEEPSIFLTLIWPLALVAYGVVMLFSAVTELAEKIKEKHHD